MDTSFTKRNTTDYQLADNLTNNLPSQSNSSQTNKLASHQNFTLKELNPLFQCPLCRGYLIDATKINSCNHTFCKACLYKVFEKLQAKCECKSKMACKCIFKCPIQDCQCSISKINAPASLKADTSLQEIIYKLVPGLYQNEMKRRKQFYEKNNDPDYDKLSPEDRGEIPENRVYYTNKDHISLSIEYGLGENQMPVCDLISSSSDSSRNSQLLSQSSVENSNSSNSFKSIEQEAAATRRYLLAPANFSIKLLKSFILNKWDLNNKCRAQIFYLDEELDDDLSLMDIAYIKNWKRTAPLKLFYRFIPKQPKSSKLAKLKASQNISLNNNLLNVNSQPKINNQINSQPIQKLEQSNQPLLKKFKLDHNQQLSPVNRTNNITLSRNTPPSIQQQQQQLQQQQLNRNTPPTIQQHLNRNTPPIMQQQHLNRNSPLSHQSMRNSPIQNINNKCTSPQCNYNTTPRLSPNTNQLNGNLKLVSKVNNNGVRQHQIKSFTPSPVQHIYNLNQQQQQAKQQQAKQQQALASAKANIQNSNNLKRTISKTKMNEISPQQQFNILEQSLAKHEYETANKYRRLLPANDNELISNNQKQKYNQHQVVSIPSQSNSSLNLNLISNQFHQQQQQQQQQQQLQRKQMNTVNKLINSQSKISNVNQLNTNLNINNLNAINNLNLNNLTCRNLQNAVANNLLNGNPHSIPSSSTVNSLRNVRVPSTEKKKPTNNLSNLSSQTISTKYNLPYSTGIPAASSNKTNSPPKTSFNIKSILEGSCSSSSSNNNNNLNNNLINHNLITHHSNKLKDDKPTINLANLNSNSLNCLNQIQSTTLDHLNINNNLSNLNSTSLPISPTSSSGGHKRKSIDKSPINELGSSVTAKGIKIFRSGLLSPTGSTSSNSSLNSSLNTSLTNSLNNTSSNTATQQQSQNLNKSNDKYSPVKTTQSNERKSPIIQPLNNNKEKTQNTQTKQQEPKIEEIKKASPTINSTTSKSNTTNTSVNSSINSLNSLNAINNSQQNNSSQNLAKIAPTLEAVGLFSNSSKISNIVNSKKGASLNKIVNKLASNGIGKSTAVSATTSETNSLNLQNNQISTKNINTSNALTNNTSSNISFSQAVNNGLKNEVEQQKSALSPTATTNSKLDNSIFKTETSNKQTNDSLKIRLPLNNSNENLDESESSTAQQINKETLNSKSLFLNSKIEVTIDEDELPSSKMETSLETTNTKVNTTATAEQVFSDDDDSMDGKLVMVIPETENSCSSSAPDDKIINEKVNQQAILKQNQSLCAIQANTPPSSSPDFSKKFSSSRSNSPVSINDDKIRNDEQLNTKTINENNENKISVTKLTADPVSPPLTPSPRLCETTNTQTTRENSFGALDLSTRKTPALAETV